MVIGRVGAQCGNVSVTAGPAWITDNAIFAADVNQAVSLEFAQLVFQQANLNEAATGSGQPFVNQTILNSVMFPNLSIEEQHKLIVRVHSAFEVLKRASVETDTAQKLVSRLKEGALAEAFRGELVTASEAVVLTS